MIHISIKEWVRLVSKKKVVFARELQTKTWAWPYPVRERYWRQISVDVGPEWLKFQLMNVDEEAAKGGYWRGGEACVTHKFKWEDLYDRDGLVRAFAREELQVWPRVDAIVGRLLASRACIQELLGQHGCKEDN